MKYDGNYLAHIITGLAIVLWWTKYHWQRRRRLSRDGEALWWGDASECIGHWGDGGEDADENDRFHHGIWKWFQQWERWFQLSEKRNNDGASVVGFNTFDNRWLRRDQLCLNKKRLLIRLSIIGIITERRRGTRWALLVKTLRPSAQLEEWSPSSPSQWASPIESITSAFMTAATSNDIISTKMNP